MQRNTLCCALCGSLSWWQRTYLVATNIQHCSRPMSGSKIGFAELSSGLVSRDSLVGGVVIPYEAFLARLINLGCQ